MFRNRKITVTVDKKDKDENAEITHDPMAFQKKAAFVLHKLENTGAKVFVGFCVYILLDTYRQVKVAETIYHQPEKD